MKALNQFQSKTPKKCLPFFFSRYYSTISFFFNFALGTTGETWARKMCSSYHLQGLRYRAQFGE